jgi:electron transfer flavoprotein beta subunit
MKILLAVKHTERALGEWDACALGAALELAEEEVDEVIAVTVGGEAAEAALQSCLALGAERAIRVWDPALEGADPLAIATVLAAVARAEQPQLILCGVQSAAGNAATGVALAGLLDLARVAGVVGVERDGAQLKVQRELEGGAVEVLRVALPALLTVQSTIGAPRHATLREIKQARAKPLSALAAADLGLELQVLQASAGSHVVRLRERAPAGGARMLEGEPQEIAAQIAQLVRKALSV